MVRTLSEQYDKMQSPIFITDGNAQTKYFKHLHSFTEEELKAAFDNVPIDVLRVEAYQVRRMYEVLVVEGGQVGVYKPQLMLAGDVVLTTRIVASHGTINIIGGTLTKDEYRRLCKATNR